MAERGKKCWYCGQLTMKSFHEIGGDWLICSNCGATHQPEPIISKHIAMLEETYQDNDGIRHYASRAIR